MWKAALLLAFVCFASAQNRMDKLKMIHQLNIARRRAILSTQNATQIMEDNAVPFADKMGALQRIIYNEKEVLLLMKNNWEHFKRDGNDNRLRFVEEWLNDIRQLDNIPKESTTMWYKQASIVLMKINRMRRIIDGDDVNDHDTTDESTRVVKEKLSGCWREILQLMMTLQPKLEGQVNHTESFNEFMNIIRVGADAVAFTWDNWHRIGCNDTVVYDKLSEAYYYKEALDKTYGTYDQMGVAQMNILEKFLELVTDVQYQLLHNDIL